MAVGETIRPSDIAFKNKNQQIEEICTELDKAKEYQLHLRKGVLDIK